jgi:glycosyltransferase involved in cell wall biosynthesis
MSRPAHSNLLIMGNLHADPSTAAFYRKFLKLVVPLCAQTIVISGTLPKEFGDKVKWIQTFVKAGNRSLFRRIFSYNILQLQLIKTVTQIFVLYKPNKVIFLSPSPLVMLFVKVCRKNVILYQGGIARTQEYRRSQTESLLLYIFFGGLVNRLADTIIVESKSSITFQYLDKYQDKIAIAPVFVDKDLFRCLSKVNERKNIIGYFGVIAQNKGVMEFLLAIGELGEWLRQHEVQVLIGGHGPQLDDLMHVTKSLGLSDFVRYLGWVTHTTLSTYLNELKLLVLPSHSEGLPNIVLEAMACGTPVLATPVGAIPDVIKDGNTGFIMVENSPTCIAHEIVRVMTDPNLEEIVRNARRLVDEQFSYEASSKRYAELLAS